MIDLKHSGLDLKWDEINKKLISKKIKIPKVNIRTLKQEKFVLLSNKVKKPKKLYYIYRGISKGEHKEIFKKNKMRYDITVIPYAKLGAEEVKTFGHYHPFIRGKKISYPEIYEVLSGVALFLLQKREKGKIVDVILIEAKKGDKVIVPPNYGHVTINHGKETLVISNITNRTFHSEYRDILKKHGAAYYGIIIKGNFKLIKNTNYNNLPELRKIDVKFVFGINKRKSMYSYFVENPKYFDFLSHPAKYMNIFRKLVK